MNRNSSTGNDQTHQQSAADDAAGGVPDGSESTQQSEHTDAAQDQAGQDNQDANAAVQPSGAEDAVEQTLGTVIRDAVKTETHDTPDSSDRNDSEDQQTSEDDSEGGDEKDADKDETKDEDKQVPFHKHPRWQEKLKKERELTRERDSYRQGHEEYQKIAAFMQENELSPDEVANGFQIMAMMRSDPEKALEALQPFVHSLEQVTGKTLPEDLQARVDDGTVEQGVAQETARLRHQHQRSEARARALAERHESDSRRASVESIQSAAVAAENDLKSNDPDYARKHPFVLDRVRSLIAETPPSTPDEAAAIVRKAHVEVSDRLRSANPRKPVQATRSTDSVSHSRPQPKSFSEAVRMAANQT